MHYSDNIKLILEMLKNEVDGDVSSALQKMLLDYTMTWMYQKGNELFPSNSVQLETELDEVYVIKNRS